MRLYLFIAAIMVLAAGGVRAQGYGVYDDPALGDVGPVLGDTDRAMADMQRQAVQSLKPYQRPQFDACMAQGGSVPDCVTSAQAVLDPNMDPYDNPALGGIGPILRQNGKFMAETHEMILRQMSPQERQEYQQCLAQGGESESNCMFFAQMHAQNQQFGREEAQADRLARACFENRDQQACDQLRQLQAAIDARGSQMGAQVNAETFRRNQETSMERQRQARLANEEMLQHQTNAYGYKNRADEARAQGLDDDAARLQSRADRENEAADESRRARDGLEANR